jgi:hypothetical protein
MADVIFISIAVYLLYRLIFDLLVPVYKTMHQVKHKFRDIHQDATRKQAHAYRQQSSGAERPADNKKKPGYGEYIDFEEIK